VTADTSNPWLPLAGLKVLEVSKTAVGAYAGKLFREFGADVVVVEDPDGESPVRSYGPHAIDGGGADQGGLARYLHAGKRSVAIRDGRSDGRSLCADLAARADLVLHEFVKTSAEERGLTYAQLANRNAAVVVVAVTPFGEDGPYASWSATEEVLFAMSGRMRQQGEPQRHPVNYAPFVVSSQIATTAAGAAMAALHRAEETGEGCALDISGLEAQLSSVDNLFLMWTFSRWEPPRGLYPPYTYPTADGLVLLGAVGDKYLQGMARASGHVEIIDDPRFNSPTALAENIAEFDALMLPFFLSHGTVELVQILQDHGVIAAPLQSGKTALGDPQYRHRTFFQPLDRELTAAVPGPFFRLEADQPPPTPAPAPRVGQHTARVLREWLGCGEASVRQLIELGVVA
jgi:crotonobetainyl-CoA:carnitine CoA-transferase CaiB-like acyl-CoA transferase